MSTKACGQSLEGVPQTVLNEQKSVENPKYAIVVNGKVLSAEEVAKINQEDIAHVYILNGDLSEKYGEKAKEGVAVIEWKKK